MLHQLKIWSAVVLIAVLTGTPLAVANGDPMTITKFTQDSVITDQHLINDCNGEEVVLNGTMHFELTTGIDADGDRTLYDLDSTTRFLGEGMTTHVRYVSVDKIHQHDVTHGGQSSNTRSSTKFRLVAQGPVPDLISRVTMHTVINRNGTILVQRENEKISCR